jgi:hypothetical protein
MTTVALTPDEVLQGAMVGVLRRVGNMKTGLADRPTYGAGQNQAWTRDCEGACGELAVAKHLGLYWNGSLGQLKAPDVGKYQVRTTPADGGRLLLHGRDPDDAAFILARGFAPRFQLAGWIMGRDGKRQDWWRELVPGRPCFVVPNEALHPMDTLP